MTFAETKKRLTLKRTTYQNCATGEIEKLKVHTIELPNRENAPQVSCIPTGDYVVRRHKSPNFGDVLKVFDADGKSEVKGRSEILIHGGNSIKDTKGCILPCTRITWKTGGEAWGENSKVALSTISGFVGGDDVGLTITN